MLLCPVLTVALILPLLDLIVPLADLVTEL